MKGMVRGGRKKVKGTSYLQNVNFRHLRPHRYISPVVHQRQAVNLSLLQLVHQQLRENGAMLRAFNVDVIPLRGVELDDRLEGLDLDTEERATE
jgi:hypothetical protein